MARCIKAIIISLILPFVLCSQSQDIKFERISVEQGLSSSIVHCILQDYQGYIWIATEDGLNKYDGYKFISYRNDPNDSTSLSNNYISSLYEDPSGNLWISTIQGGLIKYNRDNDNFISYKPNPNNPVSISSNVTQQTVGFNYDGKDVLWIGTQNGLNKMDIATQKFKYYPHTDKGYPYSNIEAMVVDSSGSVWFGCLDGGLYKFDPGTEQFTNYQRDPGNPSSLSDNCITALCLDRWGVLWIGTSFGGFGGLNKFDSKNQQFIRYQHDPNDHYSLSNNLVAAIYEDRAGNLWIGTAEGGLNRFDRETGQFIHYKHDPGNPNSLGDNTVMYIYEDKSGVLWIGTWEGIYKFDPGKKEFSHYMKVPGNPNSLSNSYIWSIYESDYMEQSILWVGTKTGGLNKLDRNSGKYTHYQYDPNSRISISSNNIHSLFEDRSGILWIGTYGDGLIKFDPIREQFTQYLNNPDGPVGSSFNIIHSIFEDTGGTLWIGNQTGGLTKFNRESGQFSPIGFRTRVMQIYEDRLGVLWIAALSGLKELDRETERYTNYWHNPDDQNSISSNKVISIHEDKTGRLWFGTDGGGLNKFDRESGEFKSYTMRDGLPNDVINGILEDTLGNLWLSTNNGLSRFNPETETFRNYDVNDGLLGNQFYPGACFRSKDGELFFGGTKGLNAFYPGRLRDNPYLPEIVVTDFQIFNEPVAVKKENSVENNDVYLLPKHISLLEEIELSYKENIFSFEFAALDYRSPQKNQYAYKMEGVDPEWVYTDASRRFATYTQLDPGTYIFRVKGSNNDGQWNEAGTSIRIVITPPWWETQLAYILYFVFCIFLFAAIWRAQIRRIRFKQQLKMEHFEAEKLREVDQLKSRFFANISHEFRTPLTLIKGPVKQIFDGEFAGNLKEQCKMILRNSDRLLGLINQILDLSKLESGEITLQVAETDIVQYLKGMILTFSPLAETKKVRLKFTSPENALTGYVDCDKLEKIVTNLLSNAFKFTLEGGEVIVSLKIPNSKYQMPKKSQVPNSEFLILNSNFLEICITNTGPGIPADRIDKIFDRFYQHDNVYKKDGEGTGIGLALTKELVELHGGSIKVKCIPQKEHPPPSASPLDRRDNFCDSFVKGELCVTTFTVLLPICMQHFKEDEIIKTTRVEVNNTQLPLRKGGMRGMFNEKSTISPKTKPIDKKSASLLLIVEDNPDVTNYISSFMQNDYRLLTAENGKDALKKTLDKYPELIISDVMMPEMDGFELCHKIKTDERISHIPIILLTAKADLDSKIEGLEFGADDYVTKPFEARELKIRAKNLIEQRKKLREKFAILVDLQPNEIAVSSIDEGFLNRLISVFDLHISESEFSTEQCAKEVGMSRSSLNRKLQALTNQSTHEFIRTLRLKRAALLLKKAAGSVAEIAYQVGFNNTSHFAKAFRRQFGQSPSEFIAKRKVIIISFYF